MKVLIVGLGSIAAKHIAALENIVHDVHFYALRSSKEAVEVPRVENIFTLSELEKIQVDFAIISNPTFAHRETIIKLIPFNIPLFIEKPLISELDGRYLINKIRVNKSVTYVACNLRFLDSLRFTKHYLSDNKVVNEVNIYCGSYLPNWRGDRDYKSIYSANKEQGGGVHIDLIHEIDYACWLFGKPNSVTKVFSNKSSLKINAFDYANYTLGYADFNVSIILNYYRRDPKRTLEIILENETITVDILKNSVVRNAEIIFESEKTITDTYEEQLRFFMSNVLNNSTTFNNAEEAYEILKICLQND